MRTNIYFLSCHSVNEWKYQMFYRVIILNFLNYDLCKDKCNSQENGDKLRALSTTEEIQTSSPLFSTAWARVRPDTGGVGHHMGDVTLLVRAMDEVRHGTHRPDANIVTAVSLRVQRLTRGLEKTVISCLVAFQRIPVDLCPVPNPRAIVTVEARPIGGGEGILHYPGDVMEPVVIPTDGHCV